MNSFLRFGHRFVVYSYDSLSLPRGVELRDARSLVDERELFHFDNPFTGRRDLGPFSDLFRFILLYEIGGWYCDIDTVCLSGDLPQADRVWASQTDEDTIDAIAGGQLFFKRGDPLLRILVDGCRTSLPTMTQREAVGPRLLTSVIRSLGLPKNMAATSQLFYPIRWHEIFKLWLPEFRTEIEKRITHSLFLPLYQSFPAYLGIDQNIRPPRGSYLAAVLDTYAPSAPSDGQHDAEEIRRLTRLWLGKNEWAMQLLDRSDEFQSWRSVL